MTVVAIVVFVVFAINVSLSGADSRAAMEVSCEKS